MKALITTVCLSIALGTASAQVAASKPSEAQKSATGAHKVSPNAGRSECAIASGLCVTIPASWQRLGDVFDDLGFVVAEPHAGSDSSTWPQLTVAAIDVPSQSNGKAAAAVPSLDALVDTVLTPDGSFTSAETLQRTHLTLNGADAEIVRVRLHGTTDAIEAIALVLGDDGLVYSIALRCAPQDYARLDPIFQTAAHSWRIKPEAAQPASKPTSSQDSEKK